MTILCWTCGSDRRCKSEEHKHLEPHAHLYPLEVVDVADHRGHELESEDWDAERADAEAL